MERPSLFMLRENNEGGYDLVKTSPSPWVENPSVDYYLSLSGVSPPCYSGMAVMGEQVYLIGGRRREEGWEPSDRVVVCDLKTRTVKDGPRLISGKANPFVVLVGDRIVVFSPIIWGYDGEETSFLERTPMFQFLDKLSDHWNPLPAPSLPSDSEIDEDLYDSLYKFEVDAYVALSTTLFISIQHFQSFSCDLATPEDYLAWKPSHLELPFRGCGVAAPHMADGMFYGLARGEGLASICLFQLHASTPFTFTKLAAYPFPQRSPSTPSLTDARYLWTPLSFDQICFSTYGRVTDDESHTMLVHKVYQIPRSSSYGATAQKKPKKNTHLMLVRCHQSRVSWLHQWIYEHLL